MVEAPCPTLGCLYIVGILLLHLGIIHSPHRFSSMLCWRTGLEGLGSDFLGLLCPQQPCGIIRVSKQQKLAQRVSGTHSY